MPCNNLQVEIASSIIVPEGRDTEIVLLARNAILDYFERTQVRDNFQVGSRHAHPDLDKMVRETIQAKNFPISPALLEQHVLNGIGMAATAYRHIPSITLQASIALYTTCFTLFDDGIVGMEAMREFAQRFIDNVPQLHPVLDYFSEVMRDFRAHYSTYEAGAIISNTLEFCNAEVFNISEVDLDICSTSSEFIEYIRSKDGLPEGYAALLFPRFMYPETKTHIQAFPDIMVFIDGLNDLLSFYKEAKAEETNNYVSRYAKAHGVTIAQTLCTLVGRLEAAVKRVRAIFVDSAEREMWDSFTAGFTEFHLYCPRYKLDEVLPEYA